MNNDIYTMLNDMIQKHNLPHLLLYSEKSTQMKPYIDFIIHKCFPDKRIRNEYIIKLNCADGKGIHCIRDELKFFAQSVCGSSIYKLIILENIEYLTSDAQSALRRIIEIYSHSTRFITTTYNKQMILNPILSRLCSIYIPMDTEQQDVIDKSPIKYIEKQKRAYLLKEYPKIKNTEKLVDIVKKWYSKGISAYDILQYRKLQEHNEKYQELEWLYEKHRQYIRDDRILMYYILKC